MTDYKNLKLIATSNPHIRGSETTRSIMLDVIIAMCPALIWAIIYFGVDPITTHGLPVYAGGLACGSSPFRCASQ